MSEGELAELVGRLVGEGELTGATLSKPRRRDPSRPSRVTVRPVVVGGAVMLQWTHRLADRATSENLAPGESAARLVTLLASEFRQGLLHARDADYQVLAGAPPKILRRPPTRPELDLAHDRRKRRVLPEGEPVPYLVELGVMDERGRVRASRQGKFRQVNRFLELVDDVVGALPTGRTLRVVDFGCGKSYLTFALHDLLTRVHGREVELVGLDLKADVIERCSALAGRLRCRGLRFELGDIAGFEGVERADLVVSLHACDTATDAALERAVRWEAEAILAVPCCQHELSAQLSSEALAPLLAHGILRERFAAEVTDAARAQLLGLAGYDVQVTEFVELEHTAKNVLIRALRRPGRDRARLAREYVALKSALGIDPWLERALADRVGPLLAEAA